MSKTLGLITASIILIFFLVVCGVTFVNTINKIKESNKLRAKIKEKRYLGFEDYVDVITLVGMLVINLFAIATIIFVMGKMFGLF